MFNLVLLHRPGEWFSLRFGTVVAARARLLYRPAHACGDLWSNTRHGPGPTSVHARQQPAGTGWTHVQRNRNALHDGIGYMTPQCMRFTRPLAGFLGSRGWFVSMQLRCYWGLFIICPQEGCDVLRVPHSMCLGSARTSMRELHASPHLLHTV